MKRINLIILALISYFTVSAQEDAKTYLKEAQYYVKNKNWNEARIFIQQAIIEINSIIGEGILKALPTEIDGLKPFAIYGYTDGTGDILKNFDTGVRAYQTYKKEEGNDKDYITVTVSVSSTETADLEHSFYQSQFSKINGKCISLPNGDRALGQFYSDELANKHGILNISFPLEGFYITIHGFGKQHKEESLIKFASKLDFEALRKAIGEQ